MCSGLNQMTELICWGFAFLADFLCCLLMIFNLLYVCIYMYCINILYVDIYIQHMQQFELRLIA